MEPPRRRRRSKKEERNEERNADVPCSIHLLWSDWPPVGVYRGLGLHRRAPFRPSNPPIIVDAFCFIHVSCSCKNTKTQQKRLSDGLVVLARRAGEVRHPRAAAGGALSPWAPLEIKASYEKRDQERNILNHIILLAI